MKIQAYVCLMLFFISSPIFGQNPFLPPFAFVPDGEPDVFEYEGEKRLFIYGSRDERVTDYCGYGHDVWSAPVDDLTQWTNHGEIFNVRQVQEMGYGIVDEQHFGAPDCVYNPVLKKYFLYTFLGKPYKLDGKSGPEMDSPQTVPGYADYGPKCVVAESDTPVGPFVNPRMCDWPALNAAGTFDPSVLVVGQEDGSVRVYAFWGMRKGDCWAELDPDDMRTIINGRTRKPDRTAWYRTLNNPTLNMNSTLFEASSIKQVDKDHFVFICSTNESVPALTYFYSNSPEGPWTYGGVIIANNSGWNGGNNHGSIVQVDKRWYVVYHRRTCDDYNRQAMIEPVDLQIRDGKVLISQVEMTSQGVLENGLDPFKKYYAGTISYLTGNVYIAGRLREKDGYNPVVISGRKAGIGWKYFNFRDLNRKDNICLRLKMSLRSPDVKMDIGVSYPHASGASDGILMLNSVSLSRYMSVGEEYCEIDIPVNKLSEYKIDGKVALFLYFESGNENNEMCRLKELEFVFKK